MKFGQSFEQRSVPAWRQYNVHYSELKAIVKRNTSIPSGNAVSTSRSFESELLRLLANDIEHASKFVVSKIAEIESRLGTVERQLSIVGSRQPSRNATGLQRRFKRIETEILRIGDEIQNLSRYVSSNRMAITKLVKKYVKWSGSDTINPMVEIILSQPESFINAQLSPLMERYEKCFCDVRIIYERHNDARPSSRRHMDAITHAKSRSMDQTELQVGKTTAIDFDIAIDATPAASVEKKATYWVHQDNVLALRVVMLQFLRLVAPAETNAQLYFDDLKSFSKRLHEYRPLPHVVASVSSGQAAVYVNNDEGPSQAARVRLADLSDFMRNPEPWNSYVIPTDQETDHVERQVARDAQEKVHKWVTTHKQAVVLCKSVYQRTRFAGHNHDRGTNTRATLDENIAMTIQDADSDFDSVRTATDVPKTAPRFQHAVLTVRYCDMDTLLVEALDQSHLTERVDDFSIGSHAIAKCYESSEFPTPAWNSFLRKDIRHVPSPSSHSPSRKSSIFGASTESRTQMTSRNGGSSTPPTEVSSASNNRIVIKPSQLRHQASFRPTPRPQGYWNEYDDGSEGGQDDEFYVYVDPDEQIFPGHHTLVRWKKNLSKLFKSKSHHHHRHRSSASEVDPLLEPEQRSPTSTSSSDDESEEVQFVIKHKRSQRKFFPIPGQDQAARNRYSTFPRFEFRAGGSSSSPFQSNPGWQTVAICMLSALITLLLVGILEISSKHGYHRTVSAATAVGAGASVIFGVIGLCLALGLSQRERHIAATRADLEAASAPIDPSKKTPQLSPPMLVTFIAFVAVGLGNGWIILHAFL